MKISDLVSKSNRVQLQHPVQGELDAWVEIEGTHTIRYRTALIEALKNRGSRTEAELTELDLVNETAGIISRCINDWDQEFFEQPFSVQAAEKLLAAPGNAWLLMYLEGVLAESKRFFA